MALILCLSQTCFFDSSFYGKVLVLRAPRFYTPICNHIYKNSYQPRCGTIMLALDPAANYFKGNEETPMEIPTFSIVSNVIY